MDEKQKRRLIRKIAEGTWEVVCRKGEPPEFAQLRGLVEDGEISEDLADELLSLGKEKRRLGYMFSPAGH